jgi:hypothetical protein
MRPMSIQPGSYEEMVALKGMSPKKIKVLAHISDIIYDAKPSWKDLAKPSTAFPTEEKMKLLIPWTGRPLIAPFRPLRMHRRGEDG